MANLPNFVPGSSTSSISINEDYTIVIDEGRPGILYKGSWLSRTQHWKAWIAVFQELTRLRQEIKERHG